MNIDELVSAHESGDLKNSLEVFKPLAEQGNAVAQTILGEMYRYGYEANENPTEALKWFRKAAEQGNANAQAHVGLMYLDGEGGVKKDSSEGRKWLLKSAEQGHEMAQYNLGEMYLEEKNISEGVYWLSKVAETGQDFNATTFACRRLAEIYREGVGVKRDVVEAIKWLQKEIEQGADDAAYDLANIYYDGEGIQQDYVTAAKWFRKAAESFCNDSHFRLGQMYLKGQGVAQSDKEAAKWFCKGAKADPDCRNGFADLYKKGVRIQEDECEFVKQYNKATEEGDVELQIRLGLKKPPLRDFINKLTIFVIGGLVTMVLLVWYDWVMIATHVLGPDQKVGWFDLILVALSGLYIGGWLSDITYQVSSDARVTGIPFPVILWEPVSIGSDYWEDFVGPFTFISPLLNACYLSLALVAGLLTVSAYYNVPHFVLIFLAIIVIGLKSVDDRRKRDH